MNETDKLTVLRMSLTDTLEGINPEFLLRWLDHVPEYQMFWGIGDLVVALLGYEEFGCEYMADEEWAMTQEIWESVAPEVDAHLEFHDDEIVIIDRVSCVEVFRAELPGWLLRLDSLMGFLTDNYGRCLYAGELRDYLVSLWFPQFC